VAVFVFILIILVALFLRGCLSAGTDPAERAVSDKEQESYLKEWNRKRKK